MLLQQLLHFILRASILRASQPPVGWWLIMAPMFIVWHLVAIRRRFRVDRHFGASLNALASGLSVAFAIVTGPPLVTGFWIRVDRYAPLEKCIAKLRYKDCPPTPAYRSLIRRVCLCNNNDDDYYCTCFPVLVERNWICGKTIKASATSDIASLLTMVKRMWGFGLRAC